MPQQFIQKPGTDPTTGVAYTPSDLLTTINPNTGKPYAGLQEASDIGGYVPVATPTTVAPVIGIDESKNQISQGSDEPRDDATAAQNEMTQFNADMDDTGVDTTDYDLGAETAKLQEEYANLKMTSEAELAQIEAAGTAAGEKYDPLIEEARETARLGRARNLVATGRRGGLQRARYVGDEVFPGEFGPGTGVAQYEGAGGKLQELAGAYQRNIHALEKQKIQAIALAKAQAREAMRSNKQQDFANAKSMLDFARQINQDIKDAEQVKWENAFKEEQAGVAQTEAERAATRLEERLEFDKQKFVIGEARMDRMANLAEDKFNYDISQDITDKTMENIKDMANARISLDQFSDERIRKLEYEAEMEPGTFEAFYADLLDERAKGIMIDDLKIKKMQADIANVYSNIAKRSKTKKEEELEGFDADLDYAADMIIRAEQMSGGKSDPTSYWNMVDKLAGASGLSSSDIDTMLISEINRKKGVSGEQYDIGSDYSVKEDIEETKPPLDIETANSTGEAIGMVLREFPDAGREIKAELRKRNITALKDTINFIKDFFKGLIN